jgi:predicted transcriptional regulator
MIEEHQYIRLHPEEPQLRRIPKTRPLSKPCIDCHEIFEPLRHSDKACNKCMTIRCLNCGKDHHVEEYRMTKHQKFCSGECVTKYIGHNNRKIDQVILVEMKALRDQGLSYKEIAAKVGFSKYAVRTNLIKSYGCDAIEHPFTHVDQTMMERMKALSDQGFPTRRIAAEIGIGKSTAARYIKRPILSFPIPRRGLVGKVNQDIIEKMKALRDKGSSYTKIATILGVCRQTVKIHLKSYKPGITVSHPSRKITPAMIEEMKILRNEGLPYERIGAKLGVIGNTVWKYLKSYKPIYVVLSRNRIHKILTHLQYSW